jgi:RNA-directed DNA polymerase
LSIWDIHSKLVVYLLKIAASVLTAYKYKNEISKNDADRIKALDVCRWRLNLKLSGCIFQSKRLGWVFYFSQADNTTCFRHIDSTVNSMLSRAGIKDKIKVKKVLKAYYEARRTDKSTHKYVVNFDTMSTVEKKSILLRYLGG